MIKCARRWTGNFKTKMCGKIPKVKSVSVLKRLSQQKRVGEYNNAQVKNPYNHKKSKLNILHIYSLKSMY